jgi:HK97 family phage major capsid protein
MDATQLRQLEQAVKGAFDRLNTRVNDIEQRTVQGRAAPQAAPASELAQLIAENTGLQAFLKGNTPSCSITIPSRLVNAAITHTAPGVADPLEQPYRAPGIVHAPERRITIRALFQSIPVSVSTVEWTSESTFSNNAAIQGAATSPTGSGETELKPESFMTFALQQANVKTIAHWISASRQILSDAPRLQGHVSGRLIYGLNLEEEEQFLVGPGTGLQMSGLNTQATAFTGGATNQTALDTLAKALNQLAVSDYEPSGVILHPSDWLSIKLAKDTTGRYILGDPAAQTLPRVWGLPVVATAAQTLGTFTVLDAACAGWIADREDAVVRISENVSDQFIRNMITILAEKRSLLVVEQPLAIVKGALSYAG